MVDHDRPKVFWVSVDRECVDIVGNLLDDGERLSIGANGDGRTAGVSSREMDGGVGDLVKQSESISAEGYDGSVSACIEDVDDAIVFGHSNWLGAASRFLIDEDRQAAEKVEAGDSAAT